MASFETLLPHGFWRGFGQGSGTPVQVEMHQFAAFYVPALNYRTFSCMGRARGSSGYPPRYLFAKAEALKQQGICWCREGNQEATALPYGMQTDEAREARAAISSEKAGVGSLRVNRRRQRRLGNRLCRLPRLLNEASWGTSKLRVFA